LSRFIAIDVDASGLFVAAGFARGGSVRVEQAVPILDDPRPLTADTAPDLARRLKEVLAAARIAPAPVLVSVGRDRVVLKDIRHPKTTPAEEPAVVRFQAQRDLAEPPDTLHLDYVPLPAPPGAEDKRATAVFVKKDLFNAARTMCELAGLKLAGFTPRPYATAAAVRRAVAAGTATPPENPAAPVGVLSLWDGGGEFVVFQGDHLVFSRSVSGMALQSEGALIGETKRGLAAFAAQSPREKLDALYLSEGHGGGGSWAARLQESLPLPVHPFDPLAGSPVADAVPSHLRGRFTPPMGLLAARGAGPLPINFVTPRQPRAEPSRGRSWVLVGLLLLLLLGAGIGGGVYLLHAGLDKRAKVAQAQKKEADELLVEEKKTFAKLKAIDDFRNRDVNALDLFWDVTEATPDISKVHMREFDLKFKPPKPEVKAIGGGGGGPTTVIGAKPGTPAKAPAPKAAAVEPVAELKLEVVSASDLEDGLVQRLVDGLFYADSRYYSKPYVDRTNQSGKRQATVKVELLPRKADTFTRKFTAVFPKALPPQPPAEDTTPIFFDEGNQP
jgi:Tfp pilus assembly PilM family ATPase